MDEMQMSLNEKEAEVIRLQLCLGDEKMKTKTYKYDNNDSTPSRKRSGTSHHNY